jgi:iron complex outermembrane receptor protein
MRKTLLISASAIAGLLTAGAAYAADEEIPADTDRPASDIIVTGIVPDAGQNLVTESGALGNKTLLDTPFSLTVVDADDITRRQATTIAQIFANDPSVSSFATAGTTNWWGTQIRGLGVRNYYVDNVPMLLYWGGDYPLEGVESVEALKGLTGFMYGFGAPGGVISYRTKRPTAEPLFATTLGYRTDSVFYGHIDAGGPVTGDGKLGYRLNLSGETGTAYNKAGVNRVLGSLALEYAFSPDIKWHGTATYERSNLKHEPFQIYWSAYEDTELPKATYDYENLMVDNSYYKSNTFAAATGLSWSLSDAWKVDATYGYTSKRHRSNKMFVYMLDQSGDYEGYAYNFAETDRAHFAQLLVQGTIETGPLSHDLVIGASYQLNRSAFGSGSYWSNDFNGNIYQRQDFLITRDIDFSTAGYPYEDRQSAAFVSDTIHLGDHVQAIVGARYTRYKLVDFDGDPSVDSGYRTTALTPTFALIYKPASHVSLYGSYVESMEGGSRVGGEYANFGDILKATVSKQYEIGLKYEHQGISFTAAGFRVERANQIDQLINGERFLTQDGLTVYKGLEAIGSYRVNETLKLGLGAVYLDPSIRNVSAGNEAILGNIPGEAARWQVVGNAEYHVPALPGFSVHGNVRYFGKAPTDDFNTIYIPARTLANIGVQYETVIGEHRVTFTGNVNNLFNTKYWGQSNIGEGINAALSARISW